MNVVYRAVACLGLVTVVGSLPRFVQAQPMKISPLLITQGFAGGSSGTAHEGEAFSIALPTDLESNSRTHNAAVPSAPGGNLRADDKACGRPAGNVRAVGVGVTDPNRTDALRVDRIDPGVLLDSRAQAQVSADEFERRGLEKVAIGDYRGAITDYTQALQINHQDANAFYNRGFARRRLRDYQGAVADFTQALKLNPKDANIYYDRGVAYSKLGNYQAEIEDYTQAIRLNHNYADAYYNRGLSRSKLGDKQGAIQDYQQAADFYHHQGKEFDYQDAITEIRKLQS